MQMVDLKGNILQCNMHACCDSINLNYIATKGGQEVARRERQCRYVCPLSFAFFLFYSASLPYAASKMALQHNMYHMR